MTKYPAIYRTLPLVTPEYYLKASPSKIKAVVNGGCPRKVFYSSVLGVPVDEDTRSRDDGTAFHSAAEALVQGLESPVGPRLTGLAAQAVARLPFDVDDTWTVERLLEGPCLPGMPFKGKVDLGKHGVVGDWKTTGVGSFRYALSRAELQTDLQMTSYGYHQHRHDPPPTVHFYHWNVYIGGRFKMEQVDTIVTWAQIVDVYEGQFMPAAQKLLDAYTGAVPEGEIPRLAHAEDVPYGDLETCSKYRGCPYAFMCSASPERRTEIPMIEGPVPMATALPTSDKIAALKAAGIWSLAAQKLGLSEDYPGSDVANAPAAEPAPPAQAKADPVRNGGAEEISQAARALADCGGTIPKALLEQVAEEHDVWPFQIMVEMDLRLDREAGEYVVKEDEPEPEVKTEESTATPEERTEAPPLEKPPASVPDDVAQAAALLEPDMAMAVWKAKVVEAGIRKRIRTTWAASVAEAAGGEWAMESGTEFFLVGGTADEPETLDVEEDEAPADPATPDEALVAGDPVLPDCSPNDPAPALIPTQAPDTWEVIDLPYGVSIQVNVGANALRDVVLSGELTEIMLLLENVFSDAPSLVVDAE